MWVANSAFTVQCWGKKIVVQNAVTNRSKISSESAFSANEKAYMPIRVRNGNRPETFKTPP